MPLKKSVRGGTWDRQGFPPCEACGGRGFLLPKEPEGGALPNALPSTGSSTMDSTQRSARSVGVRGREGCGPAQSLLQDGDRVRDRTAAPSLLDWGGSGGGGPGEK